jgi:hypothetical protein
MAKIDRYNLSDIDFQRIFSAIKNRAEEMPHYLTWFFSEKAEKNKNAIRAFQDINNKGRCFVVANGPSLKVTNLDFLRNEVTFGLNRIYLKFDSSSFRPTYYVAVNDLVLAQFADDIACLQMPKFLNWNMQRFFPRQSPDIIFLKPSYVLKDHFEPDITKPMVFGGTVTFVALQIAFYMGFKEVIIVGLDHKYSETGTPNKTEVRTYEKDSSHFHKEYFPKGVKWQLPDLLRSEIDFRLARDYYEKNGRRIIDATIGGNCQIFPKCDYETLFR